MMIKFDSIEYWRSNTWDRYLELNRVPLIIKEEFIKQEHLTVSKVLELTNGKSELKILDLACGTGRISESILQRVSNEIRLYITLVDFNPNTLKMAKEKLKDYQNVSYLLVDAYEIGNIFNQYFDVVISMEFLHHLSDLNLFLTQVKKVLKFDGVLIGNVFAKQSYKEWDKLKYGTIKSTRRHLLCMLSKAVYNKSPETVKRVIRKLGLARIDPLTHDELISSLEQQFEFYEIVTSYYYWFSAMVVSPVEQCKSVHLNIDEQQSFVRKKQ